MHDARRAFAELVFQPVATDMIGLGFVNFGFPVVACMNSDLVGTPPSGDMQGTFAYLGGGWLISPAGVFPRAVHGVSRIDISLWSRNSSSPTPKREIIRPLWEVFFANADWYQGSNDHEIRCA